MFSQKRPRMLIQYPLRLTLGLLMAQVTFLAKAQDEPSAPCCDQSSTITIKRIESHSGMDSSDTATTRTRKTRLIAPKIQPDYTSRSLMAVGRIKSIDSATSTVVVSIDREKSNLPNILLVQARAAGLEEQVIERELPKERAYKLSKRTLFLDARPDPGKTPVAATTGKIMTDPFLIEFDEFKEGDWVSVLYRMRRDPSQDPIVFNISKVDPEKNTFGVDFNPLGGKKQFKRAIPSSGPGKQPASAEKGEDSSEGPVQDTTKP